MPTRSILIRKLHGGYEVVPRPYSDKVVERYFKGAQQLRNYLVKECGLRNQEVNSFMAEVGERLHYAYEW